MNFLKKAGSSIYAAGLAVVGILILIVLVSLAASILTIALWILACVAFIAGIVHLLSNNN